MSNLLYDNIVLSQEVFQKQLKYWKEKIGDEISETTIFDVSKVDANKKVFISCLNDEVSNKLYKLCNRSPIAIYVAICTVFDIYLSKLLNCRDITILSPVIGELKDCPYNQTVLLCNQIDSTDSFKSLLIKVKKTVIDAYNNQLYPAEKILKEVDYEKDIESISDVYLQMEDLHNHEIVVKKNGKVNISIKIGEAIEFEYAFDSNIDEYEIYKFSERFESILDACIQNSDNEIKNIQFLSDEEQERVLNVINASQNVEIKYDSVKLYFENIADNYRNQIAVRTTQDKITYDLLNKRANQLARKLIYNKIGKGDIVGICLNPSIELIVAILAVIKTGATYLPIDFQMPNKRLEYVIDDSKMSLLIYSVAKRDFCPSVPIILYFDDINDANLDEYDGSNFEIEIGKEDVIYIIYTSGTSGMPKGVRVLNKGLVNYIEWFKNYAELSYEDKTILTSSYAFDLGYTGLYSAILNGSELNILNKEEYTNSDLLLSYINSNHITYMKTTPSFLGIMVDNDKFKDGLFSSVRLLVLGGENIDLDDIKKVHMMYPGLIIANHYGPTETTIGVISTKINFDRFEEYKKQPVIGKTITNAYAYILNDHLDIMPFGYAGELYISGECVSAGYLNNENLNKEKFIDNPYRPGQIMYKTSDNAKMYENGNVLFLGRTDKQIKIHGYRVEIGEIEHALKLYNSIKDTVVVIKTEEEGENYISAYIVTDQDVDIADLRKFLGNYIADYMIPKYFVMLENIPLTENGKVDYKSLPEKMYIQEKNEYVAPRNNLEEQICGVWKEILKCEQIGITDDFFILGGDSIKAIQVSSRLKSLGINIELKDIIEKTTIMNLAQSIETVSNKEVGKVTNAFETDFKVKDSNIDGNTINIIQENYQNIDNALIIEEVFGVSPMQKVMYYHTENSLGVSPYYHNRTFKVSSKLDLDKVDKAYQLLFEQYQILRTSYYKGADGKIFQVAFKHRKTSICYEDISDMNKEKQEMYLEKKIKEDGLRGFDLKKDILMRVTIYKVDCEQYFVLWSNHHMIIDGWSRMILIKHFFSNLQKIKEGKKVEDVSIDFSNYIKKLYKKDDTKAYEYWKKYLTDYVSTSMIPRKEQGVWETEYVQDNVFFELNEEETKHLINIAASYKVTFNTLVLTLWGKLLQKISNKKDVVFGSLTADRVVGVNDTDVSVGTFTNVIPVRMIDTGAALENEVLSVQKDAIEAIEYSYYAIEADNRFDVNSYFMESTIIFENYPIEEGLKQIYKGAENTIKDVTIFDQPHGPLNIFVLPFETTLFKFSFNENVFSKNNIQSLVKQFAEMLHECKESKK